ncbi:helix-turn-helix transcriptional regulator [Lactiplantibacillus pentosus]|uniref:helix-turn-helix transcriptional regulator n=1 Tax=Lactiplantibacillus pentosus TaxID=1589 RepID=UPI001B38C9CE|nr:helix-turn-helix transcriptional regulator [Lactiplantibacillus pentosus]MBQ0836293.1 helix-turn-helix transcriptional regulator [Lactiplantibacillus pentosus]
MNALKKARKELKQTQMESAHNIGISYSMYTKMESGDKNPSIETMKKVAKYFNKTVDELFFTADSH